jgi:3-hydroxy acid dehydrogenase/malonic semialdehyde reductase
VATREGIQQVFAAVDAQLGGIDILIACAALGAQPIHEMADDDWRYVIETNLVGYLACAREAHQADGAAGRALLFVGSISTDIKAEGESVYSATKAGVQAFAETLRKEVAAKNIKVSVSSPDRSIPTCRNAATDEKREAVAEHEMLHAEEIAEAIQFVLTRSDCADVVNLRIEPRLQKTS